MGATEFAPKIRKQYQTNELVVDSTEFRDQGVGGANPLSPTLSRYSQPFTLPLLLQLFRCVSVHSVQLRATPSQTTPLRLFPAERHVPF